MNEYAVGLKLKELRKSAGLTLQQVAEEASISVALLSQIENANVMPSLRTLLKLASYFRISMGSLFAEPAAKPRYTLYRGSGGTAGRRGNVAGEQRKPDCSTMVELVARERMRCYLMDLKTETGIEAVGQRSAETFLYVIEGRVELSSGQETCSIEAGDSVYLYDAGRLSMKPLECRTARIMRIEAA